MKVLDLFSGLNGWGAAFRDRGHHVVSLDLEPKFGADFQLDTYQDGRFGGPEMNEWQAIDWPEEGLIEMRPIRDGGVSVFFRCVWPNPDNEAEARAAIVAAINDAERHGSESKSGGRK